MNEIEQALKDSHRAAAAGDQDKAGAHWRRFVGLLEAGMGRTGSAEHLTPAMKHGAGQPKQHHTGDHHE